MSAATGTCDVCASPIDVRPSEMGAGGPVGCDYYGGAARCDCGHDVCASCVRTCPEHPEIVECVSCSCARVIA